MGFWFLLFKVDLAHVHLPVEDESIPALQRGVCVCVCVHVSNTIVLLLGAAPVHTHRPVRRGSDLRQGVCVGCV